MSMTQLKALNMKQKPEVGTEEYKVDQIFDMLWSFLEPEDFQRMEVLQKKAEMFEAIRVEFLVVSKEYPRSPRFILDY
ncbi:MAG: hypothetical protein ABFS56_08075 [Pseudomonadota bacterium]